MSSKFEQMRRRENRRIRANFEKTKNDIHMSNRKIVNDHHKFTEMRQRENRKIRNTNWDPANAKGFFTKTVPKLVNSIPNVAKSVANSVAGVFGGGGGRRNRPSGSQIRGSDGGGYEGGEGGGGYGGGGEAGLGPVGGPGGGPGGGEDSGSALNSEIPSAFSHVYDVDGTESSSLIPIAIGVAVVGFLIFRKK
jgi:hypothetical protein